MFLSPLWLKKEMFKLVLFVCAQGLIQSTAAQFIGAYNGLDIATGNGWAGVVAPWAAPIVETVAAPCEIIAPMGLYESAWPISFRNGFRPSALAASNGDGLVVTSASPIAPTGVSMTSETAYAGPLTVTGLIPFLGSVVLEGALPTIGGGAVAYSCGKGNVGIVAEEIPPAFGAFEIYPGPYGPFANDGLGLDRFPGPYARNGFGCTRFGCGYDGIFVPYGYRGSVVPDLVCKTSKCF